MNWIWGYLSHQTLTRQRPSRTVMVMTNMCMGLGPTVQQEMIQGRMICSGIIRIASSASLSFCMLHPASIQRDLQISEFQNLSEEAITDITFNALSLHYLIISSFFCCDIHGLILNSNSCLSLLTPILSSCSFYSSFSNTCIFLASLSSSPPSSMKNIPPVSTNFFLHTVLAAALL